MKKNNPYFKLFTNLTLLVSMVTLTACSSLGVEPWQRDLLAKQSMQLYDDPIETMMDNHYYLSREASSGGQGFGGAGCGCN